MYKVSPYPMFDVYGSRLFLFHSKTYMIYTYIVFNLQKWNNNVDSVWWLAFLNYQYIVDTIDVFSEKKRKQK